jgi:uncharacterized membrane protein HdeD (DUF308 family)
MPEVHPLLAGIETARKNWGWFLVLGIALIVLGTLALGAPILVSLASVFWIGCMLLAAAVIELISAFQVRNWGGLFLDLAAAVLYGFAGLFLIRHKLTGLVAITLMLAAYFLASGVFRIAAAIAAPLPHRVWVGLSGLIGVILGVMILNDFIKPDDKQETAFMWIGLFVGIDLIFHGWAWVMFAFAAKRLPAPV